MIDTPFFDAHTHHLPQPQITAIVSCRMDEKTASSYLQATFISAACTRGISRKKTFSHK